ncbi:MAG TPA: transposase [Polyangia bacterium]|nr:transposase [Polyangia bacterium]
MPRRSRPRQLTLPVRRGWGGARPGAGRKPGPRPLVLHRARGEHKTRHPVHVTLRARRELGSLRSARAYSALEAAIAAGSRTDFRIAHFSVQGDHVHLLVEAHDRVSLSSGLRGLSIRAARSINRIAGRSGPVWADRYHCHELTSPREVRHALRYVLLNSRKHGRQTQPLDPCSSARWFDGWRDHDPVVDLAADPPAVVRPRTWLLTAGWRRHGLIRFDEKAPVPAKRLTN